MSFEVFLVWHEGEYIELVCHGGYAIWPHELLEVDDLGNDFLNEFFCIVQNQPM